MVGDGEWCVDREEMTVAGMVMVMVISGAGVSDHEWAVAETRYKSVAYGLYVRWAVGCGLCEKWKDRWVATRKDVRLIVVTRTLHALHTPQLWKGVECQDLPADLPDNPTSEQNRVDFDRLDDSTIVMPKCPIAQLPKGKRGSILRRELRCRSADRLDADLLLIIQGIQGMQGPRVMAPNLAQRSSSHISHAHTS